VVEGEPSEPLLVEAADELRAAADELEAAVARAARAEQALSASEGLADALLGFVETPLVVLDTDLRVIGWSAGAEEAWGRTASDAVGRRWSRLGRSIDPEASASQLDELVVDGAPGSMVPFGDSLTVLLVGDGGLARYLIVTQATT
jgi:PAS domain-containing protein